MSTPKTNFLALAKNVVEAKKQPSLTLDETNILLEIDGIKALKQTIRRILSTERFVYTIYDHRYGIKEAIYEDDRIKQAHSFSIKINKDEFFVKFLVDSDYGTFEMEVAR